MTESVIPSPCIRQCCLDEQDICLGCHRSLDEIKRWMDAGPDERRAILAAARDRARRRRRIDPRPTPPNV